MTYRRETRALKGAILRVIRLELGAAERFVGQSALFRFGSSLILCPNACILAVTFDDLPFANWIIALSCAGGNAPKPHPVAGFGCKVFKYLLGAHETLQDRPGSNLLTTRRFTRMAGRNSRYHHTLKRGLEQCSPTLKSATFSRSISSLRN